MKINIKIINALCLNSTGGNPAAVVVLNADALESEEKQLIALKLGLSETAFVSASVIAYLKLEFFTPNKQIAHCGNSTFSTFYYLKEAAKIKQKNSSKKTVNGI